MLIQFLFNVLPNSITFCMKNVPVLKVQDNERVECSN